MIELFDDEVGGFYLAGKDTERLFIRSKPAYDSGVPSGNSIASLVLLKLGLLTMEQRFTERAINLLNAYSGQLAQSPTLLSTMLTALDFWIGPSQEIIIAGDIHQKYTKEMLKAVRNTFLPNAVILFHQTDSEADDIEQINPYIRQQTAVNGKAAVYICNNYVCKQPITSIANLKSELGKISKK
jgi:uncharacterized protein YyaL (SSP411 family)